VYVTGRRTLLEPTHVIDGWIRYGRPQRNGIADDGACVLAGSLVQNDGLVHLEMSV